MSPALNAAGPSRPRQPHDSSPVDHTRVKSPSLPRLRPGSSITSLSSSSPPTVSYISTTTSTSSHSRPVPDNQHPTNGQRHELESGRRRKESASDGLSSCHPKIGSRTRHTPARTRSMDSSPHLRRAKSLTQDHQATGEAFTGPADAPPVPALPGTPSIPGLPSTSASSRKQNHGSSQSWGRNLVSGAYTAGVYGAALGLTAYRLWSGSSTAPKGGATTRTSAIYSSTNASNARGAQIQPNEPHDLAPPPAYEEVQAHGHVKRPSPAVDRHLTPAKLPARALSEELESDLGRERGERDEEADRRTSPAVNALKAVVSADTGQASLDNWRNARSAGGAGGRSSKGAGRRYASDGVLKGYGVDVFDDDVSLPRIPYSPRSSRTPPLTSYSSSNTARLSLHQHPLLHNTPGRQFGRVYKKRFGTFESITSSSAHTGGRGSERRSGSVSGSASGSAQSRGGCVASGGGSGSTGRARRRKGLKGVFDTPDVPRTSNITFTESSEPSTAETQQHNLPRDNGSTREDERILEQLDEMGCRIQQLIMEGQNALAARPEDLLPGHTRSRGAAAGRGRGRDKGRSGSRGADAVARWESGSSAQGGRRVGRRYRSEDQSGMMADEKEGEDENAHDYNDLDDEYDSGRSGWHDAISQRYPVRHKMKGKDRDRLKARRSLPVVGLTR